MKPKFLNGIRHIHILGIAGTMTTPLALELKNLGFRVTGSDQDKIYPPVSTYLANANIPLNSTPISNKIDLVIVGGSYAKFNQTRKEFDQVVSLKIKYLSASIFLGKLLTSANPIIVTGSYGKTTISAALAWALTKLEVSPTYFFGGFSVTPFPSLKVDNPTYSVIEAGEDINGLDSGPKFDYYPLGHLIVTSADWEHRECYSTASKNFQAYTNLVSRLTPGSLFVYNPASASATKLASRSPVVAIPYDLGLIPKITSPLIGQANLENLSAAATLLIGLGFPETRVLKALSTFRGIKRRLEVLYSGRGLVIVDDFGQSAPRVTSAILALKNLYPDHKIIVFFEAHASNLLYKTNLTQLGQSLNLAHQVFLGPLSYSGAISKQDRSTPQHYRSLLGSKLTYTPTPDLISSQILPSLTPRTVLVHFSSGGQTGLVALQQIVNQLKSATI